MISTTPTTPPAETRIARESPFLHGCMTTFFAAGAIFFGYPALVDGGFWKWAFTVVAVLLTIGSVVVLKERTGKCPACGAVLPSIAPGGYGRCPGCDAYWAGDAKSLWRVPADAVAAEPTFEVAIPETFRMPPVCAACGGAATRAVEVTHDESATGSNVALGVAALALGRIVIRTGGGTRWSLAVPHCDGHAAGASLEKTTLDGLKLRVASLRFRRAFVELNAPAATPAA